MTITPAAPRRALLLVTVALLASACGSSSKPTASVTAATAPTAPAPSVAPMGSDALPGVPAVTANPTDFAQEPKVAAGTGTAPTQLVTRDLILGSGTAAVASDSVNVRYEGALFTDASVFDASWKNGSAPVNFPLAGVVPGFAQGIVGMKPGGRREIVIPPALGYQDAAQGAIPPNSTLVFIVDLVSTGVAQ